MVFASFPAAPRGSMMRAQAHLALSIVTRRIPPHQFAMCAVNHPFPAERARLRRTQYHHAPRPATQTRLSEDRGETQGARVLFRALGRVLPVEAEWDVVGDLGACEFL